MQPHKVEGWINTPVKDDVKFTAEVAEICNVYHNAPNAYKEGKHVISTDEKTGIQALERIVLPARQGSCEKQEATYKRHGTQCLIANFEIATGKIVSSTIGDTRTEKDFTAHIEQTIAADPSGDWTFVMDNLNTHRAESLVKLVAHHCGLNEPLGEKGVSGVLKNMESRSAFLSDPAHRIRFVYTPKHASWLNQVEIWFSILVKRLLKRLSVKSTDELKEKIEAFIIFFNKTMAKPFKWTYKGKVLRA